MEARFLNTQGELACKLMAALQGAKVIGADTRCLDDGVSSLSSFLRVAQPNDLPNNLYLDLNVPSAFIGVDPIDSLQTLFDNWGGCLGSGLENYHSSKYIQIYPNPSDKAVGIFLMDNVCNDNKKIIIIDALGRKTKEISQIPNSKRVILNYLKPGIYFCLLYESNRLLASGRIVIIE